MDELDKEILGFFRATAFDEADACEICERYESGESQWSWYGSAELIIRNSTLEIDVKWSYLNRLKKRGFLENKISPIVLRKGLDKDIGEWIALDGEACFGNIGSFQTVLFKVGKDGISQKIKDRLTLVSENWKDLEESVMSAYIDWAKGGDLDHSKDDVDLRKDVRSAYLEVKQGKYVGKVHISTDLDYEHGVNFVINENLSIQLVT